MKRISKVILLSVFTCLLLVFGTAKADDLDSFLNKIELHASKDMGSFRADLTLNFDVSSGTLDGLFEVMSKPSDVYMCLRIGEVAKQPVERVVEEHQKHKGQGWGVIAKNLGIKPGSEEFHALKSGQFSSSNGDTSSSKKNKGKSKK